MKRALGSVWTGWRQDWRSLRADWPGNQLARADWLWLGLIVLLGTLPRLVHLAYPMQYDESYTLMSFARPSLYTALTDYHLPNNHVLHSVLVHFVTRLIGDAPWMVRLPAFLAGLACIPLVYGLTLRQYGRASAVMAAALTAAWPRLVDYSADARGYSLVMLFSLFIFLIGGYLLANNNRLGWAGLVVFGSAGLFTIPVMAYPLVMLFIWLAVSQWGGGRVAVVRRRAFYLRMLASAAAIGVLTLLLYSPLLIVSGPRALFDNQFVQTYAWSDYWQRAPGWMDTLWKEWRWQMPNWVGVLIGLLALAGTALHWRMSKMRVPLQAGLLIVLALVVPIQRPELNPRPWLFLVPLLLIWAAAGARGAVSWLPVRWAHVAVLLVLALSVWLAGAKAARDWRYFAGEKDRLELAAAFLAGELEPGDVVLLAFPVDPQIWYYLTRYGVANPNLKYKGVLTRAWALVDEVTAQNLAQVLAGRDELPACSTEGEMQLFKRLDRVSIYLCKP